MQDWASNVLSLHHVLANTTEEAAVSKEKLENLLYYIVNVNKASAGIIFDVDPNHSNIFPVRHSIIPSELSEHSEDLLNEAKAHLPTLAQQNKSGIFQVESITGFYKFFIVPIVYRNTLLSFICLLAEADHRDIVLEYLISTQLSTGFFLYHHLIEEDQESDWGLEQASGLLEIIHDTAKTPDFKHACQELVNKVQTYLDCQYVAIAQYHPDKASILALSSTASFDKRTHQAKSMQHAMEEAIGTQAVQCYPAVEDVLGSDIPLPHHQELLMIAESKEVVTLPLENHESKETIGCLICTWSEAHPFNKEHLHVVRAAKPHLEALFELTQRARPSIFRRLVHAIRDGLSKHEKRLALIALGLAISLFFFPFQYRITSPATLEPVLRRQIEAPFKSVLDRAIVEPGAIVKKGQLLALLEEKDLISQLAEARAGRDQALKKSAASLAEENPSESRIAQLEAQKLSAQIDILEKRQGKLRITAPISGMVIEGDLKRFEGSPLDLGEKLLEIAPLNEMFIEIAIPEDDVRHVQLGQTVELRLDAFPHSSWISTIETIKPSAKVRDSVNSFIGQAKLTNFNENLRPGMKGKAKINITQKPLYWILLHKAWEFFRVLFFW